MGESAGNPNGLHERPACFRAEGSIHPMTPALGQPTNQPASWPIMIGCSFAQPVVVAGDERRKWLANTPLGPSASSWPPNRNPILGGEQSLNA